MYSDKILEGDTISPKESERKQVCRRCEQHGRLFQCPDDGYICSECARDIVGMPPKEDKCQSQTD